MHKKLHVVIVEADPTHQEAAKKLFNNKHDLTVVKTHGEAMRMVGGCDIILAAAIMPPEVLEGITRWDLLLEALLR